MKGLWVYPWKNIPLSLSCRKQQEDEAQKHEPSRFASTATLRPVPALPPPLHPSPSPSFHPLLKLEERMTRGTGAEKDGDEFPLWLLPSDPGLSSHPPLHQRSSRPARGGPLLGQGHHSLPLLVLFRTPAGRRAQASEQRGKDLRNHRHVKMVHQPLLSATSPSARLPRPPQRHALTKHAMCSLAAFDSDEDNDSSPWGSGKGLSVSSASNQFDQANAFTVVFPRRKSGQSRRMVSRESPQANSGFSRPSCGKWNAPPFSVLPILHF